VKKCMEYKVEGTRPRGRPKKTWREIVEKYCRARGLNTEDAMCRSRWRKQIGMIVDHDECCGWMFLLVPAHPGCPGQFPESRKTVVCVCCACQMDSEMGHLVENGWELKCKTVWKPLQIAAAAVEFFYMFLDANFTFLVLERLGLDGIILVLH